jgi:hypothetical protein
MATGHCGNGLYSIIRSGDARLAMMDEQIASSVKRHTPISGAVFRKAGWVLAWGPFRRELIPMMSEAPHWAQRPQPPDGRLTLRHQTYMAPRRSNGCCPSASPPLPRAGRDRYSVEPTPGCLAGLFRRNAGLTGLVDRMETQGWARMRDLPDRRTIRLAPRCRRGKLDGSCPSTQGSGRVFGGLARAAGELSRPLRRCDRWCSSRSAWTRTLRGWSPA